MTDGLLTEMLTLIDTQQETIDKQQAAIDNLTDRLDALTELLDTILNKLYRAEDNLEHLAESARQSANLGTHFDPADRIAKVVEAQKT
jgi:chromosome segregation ATPase